MPKKIWNLVRGYRLFFFIAIIATLLSQVFVSIAPQILRLTIDGVLLNEPMGRWSTLFINQLGGREFLRNKIWILSIIFFACLFFRSLFGVIKVYCSGLLAEGATKKLKDKLYDKIQKMTYRHQAKIETGDLIQRSTHDVSMVHTLLNNQLFAIILSGSQFLFVLVSMFLMELRLSLICFGFFSLIFIVSAIFFKKLEEAYTTTEEQDAKINVRLKESLSNIRVIRAFGTEKREISLYEDENDALYKLDIGLMKIHASFDFVTDIIFYIQYGIILILGAIFTINGEITVGTYIAFISYITSIFASIFMLARNLTQIGQAKVSIQRLSEITELESEELYPTKEEPIIEGAISFKEVYLKFEDSDRYVLKDLNFNINKGETLAIIGPTGSGKTSLVKLLPRLFDYDKGSIKIDGMELKEIDKGHIRKNIGLILQSPYLFSRSIRENILIKKPHASDSKLFDATKKANIHEDILSFKEGYDTIIGEKGISLSGGERQRVAIARMLIADPEIIIFDDSLSAVDTETDLAIREALFNKEHKKTIIIISHRISTVINADWIIVLEKGEITEQGTHKDLIKNDGLYKRIYDIQSMESAYE